MERNQNNPKNFSIKYPRNRLIRLTFQFTGKFLIKLLTKTEFGGMENYPKSGKLIVVANHTGVMETVLMTCFAPRQIEYMGSVDIPHEPQLAAFMNLYKYIPVFRGNVSPSSMKMGLEVLNQNGVIGIFPEGGIWEPAIRKAQAGVAWLSHHGNAPILPIGFSATAGKLQEALAFKRPTLKMRIGTIIPPVEIFPGQPKKHQYEQAAQKIMDAVWGLLPEEELVEQEKITKERFEFEINVLDIQGISIPIPENLKLTNGPSLSKILYRSTLINNFRDNLGLNIKPLKNLNKNPSPEEIIDSTGQILNYLQKVNPFYFTYRYGQSEGRKMRDGIHQLHELSKWASQNQYQIQAVPKRIYLLEGSIQEIIETHPQELMKW